MSDTLLVAYIGVGGVILGTLIAYLFSKRLILRSHRNTIEANRTIAFNKAAVAFRAEFAEVVFYLRQNIEDGIGDRKLIFAIINTKDLIPFERAVILFSPFLSKDKVSRFYAVWADCKKYMAEYEKNWADGNNPADTDYPAHLAASTDQGEGRFNLNKNYLHNINTLLSFAKQK